MTDLKVFGCMVVIVVAAHAAQAVFGGGGIGVAMTLGYMLGRFRDQG
jgi:hypothetical protein